MLRWKKSNFVESAPSLISGRAREGKKLKTISSMYPLCLPLKKGENEILFISDLYQIFIFENG